MPVERALTHFPLLLREGTRNRLYYDQICAQYRNAQSQQKRWGKKKRKVEKK